MLKRTSLAPVLIYPTSKRQMKVPETPTPTWVQER
jgi:hypothetical protein